MDKRKELFEFQGHVFEGLGELTEYWNQSRPEFLHAKPKNVGTNLRNWRKRHPGQDLTDAAIESALTTRAEANAIYYKGVFYRGPTEFHANADISDKVEFKNFHLRLTNWRNENPSLSPSETDLEALVSGDLRVISEAGTRIGADRKRWESLPLPKVGWARYIDQVRAYRSEHGCDPSEAELISIARPDEWMEYDERYVDGEKKQLTREAFYDLFTFKKVSLSAWSQRVNKHKRKNGSITAEAAIELMHHWGTLDRDSGILYRWTNTRNQKIYIGVTTETLEERTRGHMRTVAEGKFSGEGLHAAIQEFGLDAFKIEEIGQYDSVEALAKAERAAIKKYNSLAPNGYNLDSGGKGFSQKSLPLSFRGKKYKNLATLARDFDIPVKRLESRLRLGWDIESAVDLPQGAQVDGPFKDLIDRPLAVVAREAGLEPALVHGRIHSLGWSLEEALEQEPRRIRGGNAKHLTVAGEHFVSQRQAAFHFGIPEGTWRKRIKLGWTYEQAAGLEKPPNRR